MLDDVTKRWEWVAVRVQKRKVKSENTIFDIAASSKAQKQLGFEPRIDPLGPPSLGGRRFLTIII